MFQYYNTKTLVIKNEEQEKLIVKFIINIIQYKIACN